MRKKVHMISLGCPKNRVDSEVMVGLIQQDDEFDMVGDIEQADFVVVNTCGFIDAAKEESVNTILEMVELKNQGRLQKVIVTGCLSQRYSGDLELEIPEVDAILGTQTFTSINRALHGTLEHKTYIQPGSFIMDNEVARTNTVRGGTAYLKIAEGCSRTCSFCIIPKIRGNQQSRTIEDVVLEARKLGRAGVKEVILVAQDMTSYGVDLDPKANRDYLARLLHRLSDEAEEIDWVRLLYMYPWNFTDELVEIFRADNRILPYVDMPLQHISKRVLKSMRRNIQRDAQMNLIERLRSIDDLVLRTTFIAGYPGETDAEFQELYDWVKEVEFDRVGVFTFSPEEGTLAATLDDPVEEHVKHERRDALMSLQQEISLRKNELWIGTRTEVLVDGVSEEHEFVLEGRHYGQAPDIDGVVYLSFDYGGEMPTPGDFVEVEIQQATEYDLMGVVIPKDPLNLGSGDLRI
ncbi:MAG: 30S ribosomal protein S12 methylthiotransferase RimO [Bradymonadaceae bacterium]|nr:30S ribosomal protein S12 methylthiotransferase RimO [Lujinxingiaceae bacterium]